MKAILLLLLFSVTVSSQVDDSPVVIVESGWAAVRIEPVKGQPAGSTPMRAVIAENRNFQRNARRQQTPGALDPNDLTIDGRSAALDKINQESRAPKLEPVNGYRYHAKVRNAAEMKTEVVFLEYRFTELANPANTVRRQFLCVAKLKPGEIMEMSAFSTSGPSDVISAESLAKQNGKLFGELVQINRVEYEGGAVLQRHDWKMADWKKDVERVTSTPWGSEACRAL